MQLTTAQKIGCVAAVAAAYGFYWYNQNHQKIPKPTSNLHPAIGKRSIADAVRFRTYLPNSYRKDITYEHLLLSPNYILERGAKSAISQLITQKIIPKYGFALKFGRSGDPEDNKGSGYYPKESIMIPLYASTDREQIKRFEKYFIDTFEASCYLYNCLIGNKDSRDKGKKMVARNGDWFFLYVVVYRNNSHLNSRSFHFS